MKLVDNPVTRDLNRAYRRIEGLGLVENLAELEAFGYTVIEDAAPNGWVERAREVILDVIEAQLGRRPDVGTEASLKSDLPFDPSVDPEWRRSQEWEFAAYLLFRDPIFEEFLTNERPLALVQYLLGKSCLLSSMSCHFKGQGPRSLIPLHSDNGNGAPEPFPPYAMVANCNYALTDYTEAGGALAVVPGSHRNARQPKGNEFLFGENGNPGVIPIEIPAGAAVIWHGNTWHGSYPRRIPGIRMNLATYFCRQNIEPQESYRGQIPGDVLARRKDDADFLNLLGENAHHGWKEEGPVGRHRQRGRAGANWWS
jgi:ectoine hydroxylase-related dioxygenase (phytanoyl-CoA dioxygenase family)